MRGDLTDYCGGGRNGKRDSPNKKYGQKIWCSGGKPCFICCKFSWKADGTVIKIHIIALTMKSPFDIMKSGAFCGFCNCRDVMHLEKFADKINGVWVGSIILVECLCQHIRMGDLYG